MPRRVEAGTAGFKDHFSGVARDYARYRPTYPEALYAWLAEVAPRRDLAWDCASGNGQVARGLTPHFRTVVASDGSAAQLRAAEPGSYRRVACTAEAACLREGIADLITVGQATHWFDVERFYGQARQVARPGGVLALWSYALCRITPEVDRLADELHDDILGTWWPRDRHTVTDGYRSLPFPFEDEIAAPGFAMEQQLSGEDFLGYLGTWSSMSAYRKATGEDPLDTFRPRLERAWGGLERVRTASWPFALRVARL